jgi:hypothetical protein
MFVHTLDGGMVIELLYFDGCPNHETLAGRLGELLAAEGIDERPALRRVADADTAERERFLGSPTVRVDGVDVDPGASARTDFGLKCRLYETPAGLRGLPPDEWLVAALRRAGER